MRPIAKGDWPTTPIRGQYRVFNDWAKAIPILRHRTGDYCHLCEMRVSNPIAIEHIFHQDGYPRLRSNWNNFLLACNYCNSRKGAAILLNPYRKRYFWPHVHNTLLKFEYRPDGFTRAHRGMSDRELAQAHNTISLYKLDAAHTITGDLDQRHLARLEAWRIAIDRRIELEKGLCTIHAIVDSAVLSGFFSVWFTVFRDRSEVRAALVQNEAFHLAETGCFDEALELVER